MRVSNRTVFMCLSTVLICSLVDVCLNVVGITVV